MTTQSAMYERGREEHAEHREYAHGERVDLVATGEGARHAGEHPVLSPSRQTSLREPRTSAVEGVALDRLIGCFHVALSFCS
jgi:hypothetical protein